MAWQKGYLVPSWCLEKSEMKMVRKGNLGLLPEIKKNSILSRGVEPTKGRRRTTLSFVRIHLNQNPRKHSMGTSPESGYKFGKNFRAKNAA
jgi:hypothetical protein